MIRAVPRSDDIVVEPLQPSFGAEISNVDLGGPMPDHVIEQIRDAFVRYKVVFFRDQDITYDQQLAFAERFGPLQVYPVFQSAEDTNLQSLQSRYARADIWHTDLAWLERPPMAAILRARVIPEVGGDTMWADGEAAYDTLPEELKQTVDELFLVHNSARIGAHYKDGDERERRLAKVRALRRQYPLIAHPIVQTYPANERQYLYLNPALGQQIVGMSDEDSQVLLERLHAHYLRPENTLRFRWSKNAIGMWDERRTLHYGVYDYGDTERVMERVIVGGMGIPYR